MTVELSADLEMISLETGSGVLDGGEVRVSLWRFGVLCFEGDGDLLVCLCDAVCLGDLDLSRVLLLSDLCFLLEL